jgi:hypothetical protein
MNAEQKNTALEALRQLSQWSFEIVNKARRMHEVLEEAYKQIEDAD